VFHQPGDPKNKKRASERSETSVSQVRPLASWQIRKQDSLTQNAAKEIEIERIAGTGDSCLT